MTPKPHGSPKTNKETTMTTSETPITPELMRRAVKLDIQRSRSPLTTSESDPYDRLLAEARDGCCDERRKPCERHDAYGDGLEAMQRTLVSDLDRWAASNTQGDEEARIASHVETLTQKYVPKESQGIPTRDGIGAPWRIDMTETRAIVADLLDLLIRGDEPMPRTVEAKDRALAWLGGPDALHEILNGRSPEVTGDRT